MKFENYYYNCSPDYVNSIDKNLFSQISNLINQLPKRQTQSEINADLFYMLTSNAWYYDTVPSTVNTNPPPDFDIDFSLDNIKEGNDRKSCLTPTTLNTGWHCDFAKYFEKSLVQVEAQFGKVEAMFKDFCGFRIAYAEKRLALGIEIVLSSPNDYFAHRKNAIGGMASFDIAKNTLTTIGLDCPIWLIG